MSRRAAYRSKTWRPLRESLVVVLLCGLMPLLLMGHIVATLYPGTAP